MHGVAFCIMWIHHALIDILSVFVFSYARLSTKKTIHQRGARQYNVPPMSNYRCSLIICVSSISSCERSELRKLLIKDVSQSSRDFDIKASVHHIRDMSK